ncbi:uracil-DNA glycosylase [Rossellomorea aquimaris]|uniref:uracil-DNA glycosylase n=1 Tax=Rossellomorea aquimaris TaxID=189382 RepID=UPI001CD6B5F7|nr:uracil-DNA glycosylase [Rossellomorea aquimaris]MCA1059861.1 uracil-DNA glycosylase [Rossellomorea aquimaris]
MEPYDCEGFVYGRGPMIPDIMIVGEAPGETEIHNGMPFSGRAGKVLNEFFSYIGVSRENIYFTSTVRSRPYKRVQKTKDNEVLIKKYNRAPTIKEQLAHAPILDYEMQHIKPKQIVTLGNVGLQRLVGKQYTISEVHGRLIHSQVRQLKDLETNEWTRTEEYYSIFPTFHPASIFYNRSLEKEIYKDLDKLKEQLHEK